MLFNYIENFIDFSNGVSNGVSNGESIGESNQVIHSTPFPTFLNTQYRMYGFTHSPLTYLKK